MSEICLAIEKEPVEKTKDFMRKLFTSNIPDSWQRFEKLRSGSLSRQPDPDMTLDKYLEHLTSSDYARMIIGEENFSPYQKKKILTIRFFISQVVLPEEPEFDRFAWYYCPFDEYQRLEQIFKGIYESGLFSYERK